jgi:hypothetical protein
VEKVPRKKSPDRGIFSTKGFQAAAEGHVAQDPSFGQPWGLFAAEVLAYPSVYQPLPLSAKDVWKISFWIGPPHWGHSFAGSSENFWRSSKWLPQLEHWYSYMGMVSYLLILFWNIRITPGICQYLWVRKLSFVTI